MLVLAADHLIANQSAFEQAVAEAEKLVQFQLTPAERTQAAESWRVNLASVYERRTGPRGLKLR